MSVNRFVFCASNRRHEAALEIGKVYRQLPVRCAREHGLIRVVDKFGEDYLYTAKWFVPIELPRAAQRAIAPRGAKNAPAHLCPVARK